MSSREFIECREEMERILREETIGYLGLSMNGRPYVVPLNYGYVEGCAVEIKVTEMTGRREREGERTYWRYSFEQYWNRKD